MYLSQNNPRNDYIPETANDLAQIVLAILEILVYVDTPNKKQCSYFMYRLPKHKSVRQCLGHARLTAFSFVLSQSI